MENMRVQPQPHKTTLWNILDHTSSCKIMGGTGPKTKTIKNCTIGNRGPYKTGEDYAYGFVYDHIQPNKHIEDLTRPNMTKQDLARPNRIIQGHIGP